MGELQRESRIVLQPLAAFSLPSTSASFVSLTAFSFSDSESFVYVGTLSGNLLLLSLNSNSSPNSSRSTIHSVHFYASLPETITFLRSASIGSSAVESIQVIAHIAKVLVLSGGYLFLVDHLLLQAVTKLDFLSGVSFIAQRVVFNEVEMEENGVKWPEHEGQRFYKCLFSVAVERRLLLLELGIPNITGGKEVRTDDVRLSFRVFKEMACVSDVKNMLWINNSIIVGSAVGYHLFSSLSGRSTTLFSLPDLCSPQIELLWKESMVLLLVDNVGITVSVHGQPVGGSLVFRRSPSCIADVFSYIIIARDGKLELYHKKSGTCLQVLSLPGEMLGRTISVAVDRGHHRGYIIYVSSKNKVICFQLIPPQEQIKELLRRKKFEEAISFMEELKSEGDLTKEMVSFIHAQLGFLLLFDLHFEEAVNHFLLSETMQPSEVFPFLMQGPNRWSLLVPRNRYWGLHPPPTLLDIVIDDGLRALQRLSFLKKAGVQAEISEYLTKPINRGDVFELAMKNMIRYLEVSRRKNLTSPMKEGVDTLLMCLYQRLNLVNDMERLALSENDCAVEELEELLDGSAQFRTLAHLYGCKGMVGKALSIWRTLAKASSSSSLLESGIGESINITSTKEIAVSEASKILVKSSDKELVLQHLGWIANISRQHAIGILISEEREGRLPPDEVIEAIGSEKVEILQRYLQWLIEDGGLQDIQLHTLYALSLAKSAIEDCQWVNNIEGHYSQYGIEPGANPLFQQSARERLRGFLQLSELYDAELVLDLIEGSELWLEKAILYRKLGQESFVLQILALKLEDSEAAEQYCAEIGRPDAYMQLLELYLDPQEGRKPFYNAAVRLLHNHGELLDPLQVLEALNVDMPLHLGSETILRMLRARVHHHHQWEIAHRLSRAVSVDTSLSRLEERSRRVQINEESHCDSCRARLGTRLFAVYPDDSIVCYKCFRRQGESTSARGWNFKLHVVPKPGWLVCD